MRNFATTNRFDGSENVSVTGTSAQSSAVPDNIYRARLHASAAMWVAVGPSATATTASVYFPAGHIEYVDVRPGERIAAIQDSTAGVLNVAWLTS